MTAAPTRRHRLGRMVLSPVGLLVIGLAVMWAIEIVDTTALDHRLQQNGIHPRKLGGLDGVLTAPFLHSDYGHLVSNSGPLLALGGLVAVRGRRYWSWVTAVSLLLGGLLTWALADGVNHIGASGVVFGYLGAILGAAIFERRLRSAAPALVVLGFYSGLLAGLVPQEAISWEGHLFGLLSGALVSVALAEPAPPRIERPEDVQDWEADEPWLGGPSQTDWGS